MQPLRQIWSAVSSAMGSWHQGKLFIEHSLAVGHDSLHVVAGVVLLLAISFISRRPISAWRPWLWLLALALWNETVDLWVEVWPDPGQQYGEGAKDVLLTMLLPTILLFAARYRPDLFRRAPRKRR